MSTNIGILKQFEEYFQNKAEVMQAQQELTDSGTESMKNPLLTDSRGQLSKLAQIWVELEEPDETQEPT